MAIEYGHNPQEFNHAEQVEALIEFFEQNEKGLTPSEVLDFLTKQHEERGTGAEVMLTDVVNIIQELEGVRKIERVGTSWKLKN